MGTFRWGIVAFAAFSLTFLVCRGSEIALSAPLREVLNSYDSLLGFLLGWSEPYLRYAISALSSRSGWHLTLHWQWQHMFVLLWAWFLLCAFSDLRSGRGTFKRLAAALSGLPIALVAGVVAGLLPLHEHTARTQVEAAGFLLCVFIVAVFAWSQGRLVLQGARPAGRLALAIVIYSIGLLVGIPMVIFLKIPTPALEIVAFAAIAIAFLTRIVDGFEIANAAQRWKTAGMPREYFSAGQMGNLGNRGWWTALLATDSWKFLIVLTTVASAACAIILTNAGLRAAGL